MKKIGRVAFVFGLATLTFVPQSLLADSVEEQFKHASDEFMNGDFKQAESELEAILHERPEYENAKLVLGETFSQLSRQAEEQGDKTGAVALIREALQRDDDEPYWHSALAKLLHMQGLTEEATKECARAAQLFPDDSGLAGGCGFGVSKSIPNDNTIALGGERGMLPPIPRVKPAPALPQKAREAHVEGTPVLWIVVGVQGDVEKAEVVKPFGLGLDESAVRTVLAWKFKPASKDGSPVRVRVMVQVSFRSF